ncbi:MAG TPA: hypothetical protein VMM12_06455 [Longimicrobiales bacterium]|nr:hypothetical protein [Longimicrobiales bacterium]
MNHFEYVMVLISIIIGLGIAHILLGLGGIIDRVTGRGDRLRLSVAISFCGAVPGSTRCGSWTMLFWLTSIIMSVIGLRARGMRYHVTAGVTLLLLDFAVSVVSLPRLAF